MDRLEKKVTELGPPAARRAAPAPHAWPALGCSTPATLCHLSWMPAPSSAHALAPSVTAPCPWQTSFYDQPGAPPEELSGPEAKAAAATLDDLADLKLDEGETSDEEEVKVRAKRPAGHGRRSAWRGSGSAKHLAGAQVRMRHPCCALPAGPAPPRITAGRRTADAERRGGPGGCGGCGGAGASRGSLCLALQRAVGGGAPAGRRARGAALCQNQRPGGCSAVPCSCALL